MLNDGTKYDEVLWRDNDTGNITALITERDDHNITDPNQKPTTLEDARREVQRSIKARLADRNIPGELSTYLEEYPPNMNGRTEAKYCEVETFDRATKRNPMMLATEWQPRDVSTPTKQEMTTKFGVLQSELRENRPRNEPFDWNEVSGPKAERPPQQPASEAKSEDAKPIPSGANAVFPKEWEPRGR